MRCWGDNSYGQLGDGTTTNNWTPTAVSDLGSGVEAIAVGGHHTCALTAGRGVLCWGSNYAGKLGDGTATDRWTPTAVGGLGSRVAVALSAGGEHTCAVITDGAVRCWGWNIYGQLGDGTTTDRWTPTAVSDLGSGVEAIAAGGYHTCALTAAGAVRCWGNNGGGRLGDGTTNVRWAPTWVTGLDHGVEALAGWGRPHVRGNRRWRRGVLGE